jgi:hypothetical protein
MASVFILCCTKKSDHAIISFNLTGDKPMKLRDYLFVHGIKLSWLAKKIGYTSGHLSSIAKGRHYPSSKLMIAIENATDGKVTAADF